LYQPRSGLASIADNEMKFIVVCWLSKYGVSTNSTPAAGEILVYVFFS